RPRARAPRSDRPRACPSAPGTAGRRPTATRRSVAAPRRRWCRRRASSCPIRTGRRTPPAGCGGCRCRCSRGCAPARRGPPGNQSPGHPTSEGRRSNNCSQEILVTPRHTGSMAHHEYTGHVDPGGPSGLQVLPSLEIRKASVGPMDNNAYLLTCRSTGAQLLIDAAADEQRLLELVGGTGAGSAAGAAEAPENARRADREPAHGDVSELGREGREVISLRGHRRGSVALRFRGGEAGDDLFTGDSLFPGGVGNTFGDAEAFAQLIDDVQQRLFDRLGDATWVYPGHGDDTTLGAERPSLPTWRERGW